MSIMANKKAQYGAPTGSYGESLIPLVLILILGIFIAGKLGYIQLNSLPVVGSLFPAPYINVIVIGHASPQLEYYLKSENYRVAGINYMGYVPQEAVVPGTLNKFDIIILQGSTICDRTARRTITDRVKAGGKLMVIGDACTRVNDDPNALGWDIGIGLLGDVMPVTYGGVLMHEATGQSRIYAEGKFRIIAPDHPMFNGIKNSQFSGTLTNVYPTANANVLAYIETYMGKPTSPATFGILESQGFLSGKTIYFAFDPGTQTGREMLQNTLLYLKGAKG
ncbi:hypothetical protein AUJ16_01205 [Candidatus Micrarchaeota archaeon CG1_02_60_51]|nr:MAG: hypothetical protein AUJ16_01205 [Candidatus Micrarchaeota archaeon CG1_02_60_51]PIO01802.1 MAG: hypothetical protein COT58_03155 [Candidatus Micrarchaeota archaeon CG09_land_8_20_14_0_10_60_16]PIY92002.1 MAG: hypothetical protein COY71_00050 [Candidatus Micrarchaeota archaeon CG_4_10_14_0_8_um_filter_60_7]